jgi:hypothetical protein
MKTEFSSQNKRSAETQRPVTTQHSKQTAIAVSTSRNEVAKRASTLYLIQGTSTASSMRLITERASSTAQVPHEVNHDLYYAYTHWGLNE